MSKFRVAVVDDDPKIRESLSRALRLEGYEVATISNGLSAFEFAQKNPPDIWLIDIMMPDMDGIELTLKLRDSGIETPILMLTAKGLVKERVRGLDAGADDYLPKPFELSELLARVRSLLRRLPENKGLLTIGGLTLAIESRAFTLNEIPMSFTKTEYHLLYLLIKNQGKTLEYKYLYEEIWGGEQPKGSKNIPVYIKYIKDKLGQDFSNKYIHNVRGVGYKMSEK